MTLSFNSIENTLFSNDKKNLLRFPIANLPSEVHERKTHNTNASGDTTGAKIVIAKEGSSFSLSRIRTYHHVIGNRRSS